MKNEKSDILEYDFKKPTSKIKERGDNSKKREDISGFESINKKLKLDNNKFGRLRSQSENICDYSIMGFMEKAFMRKKSIIANH